MAQPVSTLYVKVFGSYTVSAGGPLRLEITHGGTPVEDRVADQEYPAFLGVVDKFLEAVLYVRDISIAKSLALGAAAADKAFTLAGKSDITGTLSKLILISVRPSANRAQLGEVALTYRHESTDGTTVPIA